MKTNNHGKIIINTKQDKLLTI